MTRNDPTHNLTTVLTSVLVTAPIQVIIEPNGNANTQGKSEADLLQQERAPEAPLKDVIVITENSIVKHREENRTLFNSSELYLNRFQNEIWNSPIVLTKVPIAASRGPIKANFVL